MHYKLDILAALFTGIHKTAVAQGEVYYVQARHFDKTRAFIPSVKPELAATPKLLKYYLQPGDILIVAKGSEHFAVCYSGSVGPAVASSAFIIIRLHNQQQVLPAYLCWFLNHPDTQRVLSGKAKGTSLPAIAKPDIADLTIPVPALKRQQDIIRLYGLLQQTTQLVQRLQTRREHYIQQLLLQSSQ